MNEDATLPLVRNLMLEFAGRTGLSPAGPPRRYLWTDAFAVCNFIELFHRTQEERWRDLAWQLVQQVHEVLGRHRDDDPRSGWISGLSEEEGRIHPTIGGLRIGKALNERPPGEPFDEQLEWERDGQYYHYLTKWMHALDRLSRLGDATCHSWAVELAATAHARFLQAAAGGRKRLCWKMSIDLTRPLVPAMGQHDPLDGLATFSRLRAAPLNSRRPGNSGLDAAIGELTEICQGQNWATNDPLGTGGLLFDACRIAPLIARGEFAAPALLEAVLEASRAGLESFAVRSPFRLPAAYRLPFRELGLSIGLKGIDRLRQVMEDDGEVFEGARRRLAPLLPYVSLGEQIDAFWLEDASRGEGAWTEHREINTVMLATSLAPGEFLGFSSRP